MVLHDVRRVYRSEWDSPGRQLHGGHVERMKLASCTLGQTWGPWTKWDAHQERVMPDFSMSFQFNFSSAVAAQVAATQQCPVFFSRPGLAASKSLTIHGGSALYSACHSLNQNGYG